jgi:hypothetical protein
MRRLDTKIFRELRARPLLGKETRRKEDITKNELQ